MVHCPIFLKKEQGISITELLIVVAFLAVMTVFLLVYLNPGAQLGKARDARRKSDLSKLKNVFEDYYNDKKCYPSSLDNLVPDYLGQLPTDPLTRQNYAYYPTGCDKYRIYVKLDYEKDPAITEVGCQDDCGPPGNCVYNYGVSSSNVGLEGCGEEECAGAWWGCQGIGSPACTAGPPPSCECNNLGATKTCPSGGTPYCEGSSCGGGCVGQIPCLP